MRLFTRDKFGQSPVLRTESRTPPEALLVGSVLVITALLYAATLRFGFVYDDEGQIVQNVLVHFWRYVPQYFRGDVWSYLFPSAVANYYRPLNLVWFRVNDALFGLHPAGWHASAVGLHLLDTFLAYKVVRRVTGRPLVAALTALIFAVHPTRHEVVAWVSGTTESLWAAFFLLAFLCYLQSREKYRGRWLGVSCVLYGAALLCKETAIVLPALVFAHAWIYGERLQGGNRPWNWRRLLPASGYASVYVAAVVPYLIVRIHVLHGFSHALTRMPLRTFVFTLPSILFFYVQQWLLPVHMSVFYNTPSWSHFSVRHVLLPLLGVAFVVVVVWFFRRQLGRREVAFAAACILIPLAPVMDLAVLPPAELAHDRYFYIPGLGAALLVALAFEKLARGKMIWRFPQRWLLAVLALLMVLCYDTANASRYWANNDLLYAHCYRISPHNFIVRNNYAYYDLEQKGDYAGALKMFQSLLRERPNNRLANFNMGHVLYLLGLYPAATHFIEVAQRLAPGLPDTYLELALVDLRTNRPAQAEANVRHAISIRPEEPMFHYAFGAILMEQGKCTQARPQFAQALVFNPDFPKARELMEKCTSDTGPAQLAPASAANDSRMKTRVPTDGNGAAETRDPAQEKSGAAKKPRG